MFKKFLFLVLLIFITLTVWKQDSTAKTWERYNTTVSADSILAAIERGDSVEIRGCEISSPLIKEGTWEKPDTIKSFIRVFCSTVVCEVSRILAHSTNLRIWNKAIKRAGNKRACHGTICHFLLFDQNTRT